MPLVSKALSLWTDLMMLFCYLCCILIPAAIWSQLTQSASVIIVGLCSRVAECLFVLAACFLGKEKRVEIIQRYFTWMLDPYFIWLMITKYFSYTITFIHIETCKGMHATWNKPTRAAGNRRITGTCAPELEAKRYVFVHVCAASILDDGTCMVLPRRAAYWPRRSEGGGSPHLAFPP
jgi:hypothetical protein